VKLIKTFNGTFLWPVNGFFYSVIFVDLEGEKWGNHLFWGNVMD